MKHTSTIKNFKSYCNSNCCPKYISKYVDGLSDDEFILFYNEVKLAASYLIDEDYLFYKMFWIMKYPWNNLSEELFLQLFFNIEGYDLSKIIYFYCKFNYYGKCMAFYMCSNGCINNGLLFTHRNVKK